MAIVVRQSWWALVLRGLVSILIGVLALFWPQITLQGLVLAFGVYAMLDGFFSLYAAATFPGTRRHWWALLAEGIAGVLAGLFAFFWTGITLLVLLYVIGVWAVVTGILEMVSAIRLRKQLEDEWLLGLMGFSSVVLGLVVLVLPGAAAVVVAWVAGTYALLFGSLSIALGYRLRLWAHAPQTEGLTSRM